MENKFYEKLSREVSLLKFTHFEVFIKQSESPRVLQVIILFPRLKEDLC